MIDRQNITGLAVAITIGLIAYAISVFVKSNLLDTLVLAMVLGIAIKSIAKHDDSIIKGAAITPKIFIPIGIAFYAIKNVNFVKLAEVDLKIFLTVIVVLIVYIGSVMLIGLWLKQKKEITYLTATGSAICGASAIAITSHPIDAEPDDVSISLLAVVFVSFLALFIVFPLVATLLQFDNHVYALFSGCVLQFTGFVKAAMASMPPLTETVKSDTAASMAIAVKAVRFLALFAVIPIFTSLKQKRFRIPGTLWLFLAGAILGSVVFYYAPHFYKNQASPFLTPMFEITWAIAMAAIGLNADLRLLISNKGLKAMLMALIGFFMAILAFIGMGYALIF